MHNAIKIGDMTVTFQKSHHETDGAFDLYELTIPPNSRTFLPHFHRDFDETVLGIDGISHWNIDGQERDLGPSEQLYISRGVTHFALNLHKSPARVLCLITPGLLGPDYFEDLSALKPSGSYGFPKRDEVYAVMHRYGVIPVTLAEDPS